MKDEELPPLTPDQLAYQDERQRQLVNQQMNLHAAVRTLHINLYLANRNRELTPEFKQVVRAQLLQLVVDLEDVGVAQ